MSKFLAYVWICLVVCAPGAAAQSTPAATEGDYVAPNFHFRSGEVLPSLRLHYTTFGTPKRDASGRVTNAVMVLHGRKDDLVLGRNQVEPLLRRKAGHVREAEPNRKEEGFV